MVETSIPPSKIVNQGSHIYEDPVPISETFDASFPYDTIQRPKRFTGKLSCFYKRKPVVPVKIIHICEFIVTFFHFCFIPFPNRHCKEFHHRGTENTEKTRGKKILYTPPLFSSEILRVLCFSVVVFISLFAAPPIEVATSQTETKLCDRQLLHIFQNGRVS